MTHEQLSQPDLAQLIRQQIANGWLPCIPMDQIDGGYGDGNLCEACRTAIGSDQVEYEAVEPVHRRHLRFHIVCYTIWQRECRERAPLTP
jgi:hypothetical protein